MMRRKGAAWLALASLLVVGSGCRDAFRDGVTSGISDTISMLIVGWFLPEED